MDATPLVAPADGDPCHTDLVPVVHTGELQEASRSGAQEEVADAAEGAALEFLRALPLLLGPPAWPPANEHVGAAFLEVCSGSSTC